MMKSEQLREFQVNEFMSKKILTVGSESEVGVAVDIMVKNEVGGVVVLEGGRPVGLFTERDLLKLLAKGGSSKSTCVKDVMSSTFGRISPSGGSQEAAKRMVESKSRLLVFGNGRLDGIVTASDMVKVIYRTGVAVDISGVISKKVVSTDMRTRVEFVIREMESKGVGSIVVTERRVPRAIFTERDLLNKILYLGLGQDTIVDDVATFPLVTAEIGINGRDVAGAMVSRRIKRLPLMLRGKICGIVTARDLVQSYAYPHGIEDAELVRQARVRYGELCPICNSRIDDRGLCACGAGGD